MQDINSHGNNTDTGNVDTEITLLFAEDGARGASDFDKCLWIEFCRIPKAAACRDLDMI